MSKDYFPRDPDDPPGREIAVAGIQGARLELQINGRPLPGARSLHFTPGERPLEDLDRQLIKVWLGAEVWRDIRATEDRNQIELRLQRVANRSRAYRRWKFHLLARCSARQVERIIDGQG